ncbi:hypothetical protein ATN84_17170 [Paramesorhizobium deserti]|uniref:Uncharacterized protein n=1 Tax=Paramesorhizobium deserti TaxID=1494590 RepID=A0A135HR85_9HYPH|nr:hypothetical protein [Paramesorhizobium deserti]KXF75709.1 hypothetical protein ATN84_17170 [Paramesorhizobium deserti]
MEQKSISPLRMNVDLAVSIAVLRDLGHSDTAIARYFGLSGDFLNEEHISPAGMPTVSVDASIGRQESVPG